MFIQLGSYQLEAANFGDSANDRVLVIRLLGGPDVWEQVEGTRLLLIGGKNAREEFRRLLDEHGRTTLAEMLPGGVNGRSHTAMRKYVGL